MRWLWTPTILLTAVAGTVHPPGVCCTVSLHVHVPPGTGPVYVGGSLAELGPWHADGKLLEGTGVERTTQFTIPAGTAFEYKYTLGSWDREAVGTNPAIVPPNHRLVVTRDTVVVDSVLQFKKEQKDYIADWKGSGVLGRLVYWTDVHSAFLGPSRNVEIWLPPVYDQDTSRRYPVLYMSDGQNLFDPRLSYGGIDWGVDSVVMDLVARKIMPPIIVVGVWNSAQRFPEYSPWHDAPKYARFLIEELMPRVNKEFRTLTGPNHTAHMGSSMGGLLGFYLVTHHPEAFGSCACMSTHFPLSPAVAKQVFPAGASDTNPDTTPYLIKDIAAGLRAPKGARYWFDRGTLGLDSAYGPTYAAARAWLLSQGFVEGKDFVVRTYPGATHNEASWRARLADPLTFLFGGSNR
jgi:S-formylglutathione hydrolase FrmB